MASKKKTDRRKSQIFDLRLKDSSDEHANILENEELKQIYQNKNYEAPELKQFETIHESPSKVRRGLIEEDGTLNIGKSRDQRYIDFASRKYWRCDDKEKNKKRKAMITKQFKGRKRKKMAPLSDKACDELLELIENKEDTIVESEGDEEENEHNYVVEGFVLNLPGTVEGGVMEISQQMEKTSFTEPSHSVAEDDQDGRSIAANSKLDHMDCGSDSRIPSLDCVWKSVKTSSSSSAEGNPSDVPATSQDPPNVNPPSMTSAPLFCSDAASGLFNKGKPPTTTSASSSTNSELSSVNSETIKIRDETLSSATCSSVFDVCSESPTQEEIMKLFNNTEDLLFCGENTGSKPAKKDTKRRSVRRSVRRSARFQPKRDDSESGSGSIFAIEEFEFNDRRKKNRKAIPSIDDDVFEETETFNTDRLSIPEQLRDFKGFVSSDALAAGSTGTAPRDSVLSSLESDMQPSVSSEKHFYEASADADEEVSEPPNKSKRRSSTYKDLSISISFGGGSGHDISLPAVVRRSLTGEFVPRRSGELSSRTSLEKVPSSSELQLLQSSDQVQPAVHSQEQVSQTQQYAVQSQQLDVQPQQYAVQSKQSDGNSYQPTGHTTDVQVEEAMDHDGEAEEHRNDEALVHKNDVMEHGDEVLDKMAGAMECKDTRNESCNISVAITPASRKSLLPTISKKDESKPKCKSRLKFLPANPQKVKDKQKQVPPPMEKGASCIFQESKAPARLSIVPKFNTKGSVKSVSEAFLSDSEEEEIISGMFGSKQMSRNMMKEKEKINRGFLHKN